MCCVAWRCVEVGPDGTGLIDVGLGVRFRFRDTSSWVNKFTHPQPQQQSPLPIIGLNPTCTPPPPTHSAPFRLRMEAVAKGYASVCSGRVLRIIPAFGIGGFLNDCVKEKWEENNGR
jgi:hypothetical protein